MNRAFILPGYGDSDAGHWQSHWQSTDPRFERIHQQDWIHARKDDWVQALDDALAAGEGVTLLVAHSMGCLLVAHWAAQGAHTDRVGGALLVAPPDPSSDAFPPEPTGFAPVPMQRLPFAGIVVASSDDPYGDLDFTEGCARAWGCQFRNIGPAGHVNVATGHGPWPAGRAMLRELGAWPGDVSIPGSPRSRRARG
jgi:predicted alpha/beta hydrolase family esterase